MITQNAALTLEHTCFLDNIFLTGVIAPFPLDVALKQMAKVFPKELLFLSFHPSRRHILSLDMLMYLILFPLSLVLRVILWGVGGVSLFPKIWTFYLEKYVHKLSKFCVQFYKSMNPAEELLLEVDLSVLLARGR